MEGGSSRTGILEHRSPCVGRLKDAMFFPVLSAGRLMDNAALTLVGPDSCMPRVQRWCL